MLEPILYRHVERGPKWCPGCETEYEGNYFSFAGKPRGKLDEQGRVIHPCDSCIEKWEAGQKRKDQEALKGRTGGTYVSDVPDDMVWPGEPR